MIREAVIPILLSCLYMPFAEEDPPSPRLHQIERLKEEIYSLHLIELIELTAHQIDFILKRSALAAPVIHEYERKRIDLFRRQREIFAKYLEESRADEGFSAEVDRETRLVYQEGKDLVRQHAERLNRIAEPIMGIFTGHQLAQLENYQPVLFPGEVRRDLASKSHDWRIETLKEVLIEAQELADAQYRSRRDKLVSRMLNTLPPGQLDFTRRTPKSGQKSAPGKENREEVEVRLGEALDAWRTMPHEERTQNLERFILTRILPSKVQQKEIEMTEVRRSKRAVADNTARFLLNQDVVPYLKALKKRRPKGPPVEVQ